MTLYHITNLCPRSGPSGCGFSIQLWPEFKKAVKVSGLTQKSIDDLVQDRHRAWLDGCGYRAMFDPKESAEDRWKHDLGSPRKLSGSARPLYGVHSIRISWGEWGPEHITVPGNSCGLDISDSGFRPPSGRVLQPHNIDNLHQVVLILTIFTTIADYFVHEPIEWPKQKEGKP